MIDVATARNLLDMGARIGAGQRADEQLEGAVALYNLLSERKVAYLADEVGMGKTYVALGALALFRHLNPSFRVLVLAPRENIQQKWQKEFRNFICHNVKFRDMRVKGADGLSMRPLVDCGSLLSLVHEATIAPDRDFFMRMTSFSLALPGKDSVDPEVARRLRDGLRACVPWLDERIFDLRNKQNFKENFAKAVCCALPAFDLVIVDEGHNLKHGFSATGSARNFVLGLAMGRSMENIDHHLFPRYGPRAKHLLLLSATPVEETYRHLWNQLDVFGLAGPYGGLNRMDVEEDAKKVIAGQFLIRRVTSIRVGEQEYTKNLYRREWRRGGVILHDDPIRITDIKQRLAVALVQKKVAEILGNERFKSSFQIGMLASFESFLQTAKVFRNDPERTTFDDSDQAEEGLEKDGVDVADVNRLADSYRRKFDSELPHPKMDSLVESLNGAWNRGAKALVFVRRVASVKELKRKLDEKYDAWLMDRLLRELPPAVIPRLEEMFKAYREERRLRRNAIENAWEAPDEDADDSGGLETFFAWFFRGEGPPRVLSGARIQGRFIERGTALATFFEENYLSVLFGCEPQEVLSRLASELSLAPDAVSSGLRQRSRMFLSSRAKRLARADRFEAIQAAAIEWLSEVPGPHQAQAKVIWSERFLNSRKVAPTADGIEPGRLFETKTFFTELRKREGLRARLFPASTLGEISSSFHESELRRQMLASAARLGHAFIDFYILVIGRIGSLELRAQEGAERDEEESGPITEYIDMLERQMDDPSPERAWGAYDELAAIAANFELIMDVNMPDLREAKLAEAATRFGKLLRQQQPVGGMAGQVNKTLVAQFRMPGYPFVMISTDLLQEGEDLHTFCSAVYHYGISWTPSSMEQRTGRIDRVRSETDRRLGTLATAPEGKDLLQVYLPHLEDTVEVFQVQRVLERMNTFLRLMHAGLTQTGGWSKRISVADEVVRGRRDVPPILEPLKTAFPVKAEHLQPEGRRATIDPAQFERRLATVSGVFTALSRYPAYRWEAPTAQGAVLGTAVLADRIQPFALHLANLGAHLLVRCVSPIGNVGPDERMDEIIEASAQRSITIGAIRAGDGRTYDLSVEGEVLLAEDETIDVGRVLWLVNLIVSQADEMEQQFLPGQDANLSAFRSDLEREGLDGR